jgi:hypothetical protein
MTSPSTPPPRAVPPLQLAHDAYGRLIVTDSQGNRFPGVEPVRAFPLTDPDRWIALLDDRGREIHLIEAPDQLAPDARRVLLDELARREFLPVIQSIESISGHAPRRRWTAVTDRGRVEFQVEGDDSLRRLGPHRLLVTDRDGLRYLIEDTQALPPKIRRKLQALA